MNITGKITGIKYKILLEENLKIIDVECFNINDCPAYCLVKDGLLKMILYSNLSDVEVNGVKMNSNAVLKLNSKIPVWDSSAFLLENNLSLGQVGLMEVLMEEAVENGFEVKIYKSE